MRKSPLQLFKFPRRARLGWGNIVGGAALIFLLGYSEGETGHFFRDISNSVTDFVGQMRPAPSVGHTAHVDAPVAIPSPAGTMTARVVGVTDGDTMTVLSVERRQIRVRLTEIDAPESDQPWGTQARNALTKLTLGKDVEIHTSGTDQYGRTLGRVYNSGTDVSAEMIRAGHAWAYRDYLTDASLLAMEAEARSAKRGLWALPGNDTIAPWSWRRGLRPPRSLAPAADISASDGQCSGKRYCRQMTSCAEARFYLNVCRVGSLDGDNDAVPCENICGH